MVGSDAVREAMGSTSVLGNISADGRRGLARGVWCKVEAERFCGACQVDVHQTWLDNCTHVFRIDFADPVHS